MAMGIDKQYLCFRIVVEERNHVRVKIAVITGKMPVNSPGILIPKHIPGRVSFP
jgi:hypothetical protein